MARKIYNTEEDRKEARKRNKENFKVRHRDDLEKKKKYSQKSKEWFQKQSDEKKKQLSENAAKNRKLRHKKDPRHGMFHDAKKRAKAKNIEFTISIQDLIVPEICPVFGVILEVGDGIQTANSPSIDRIDPLKGYIQGNIAIISYRANAIKSDASIQELEQIINYMRGYQCRGTESVKKLENE